MDDEQVFWAAAFLIKLNRGDRLDDCKAMADKATAMFADMRKVDMWHASNDYDDDPTAA